MIYSVYDMIHSVYDMIYAVYDMIYSVYDMIYAVYDILSLRFIQTHEMNKSYKHTYDFVYSKSFINLKY